MGKNWIKKIVSILEKKLVESLLSGNYIASIDHPIANQRPAMPYTTLTGIIPPLVTPLTTSLEFDRDAFIRLIDHVIEGSVHGVFILGTTGEGASVTDKIREHTIETAVRSVAGRVPVLVNISSSSYLQSLEYARRAEEAGADYAVLSPPCYYSYTQNELERYFLGVANRCGIPLFLYNAPQYTGNELEAGTVRALSLHAKIAGIKDSSGNIAYIRQLPQDRVNEKFSILIGPEKILGECVLMGCDGGVNGGGNLFPGLYVQMFRMAQQKNTEKMKVYQALIDMVYECIYEVPSSPMGIIIALKYALSRRGICGDTMAVPVYDALKETQKQTIDDFIDEMETHGF